MFSCSDGNSTQVFPVASGIAVCLMPLISGTLNGVMPAITPNGFSNNVAPVDFDLALTPTISGNVTDDLANPRVGVQVEAYDVLGALVATAITDGAGNYTIGNLYSGRDCHRKPDPYPLRF